MIVRNNEVGFNPDNVDAICAVGETTKKKGQGYIGEKGIGFKSVFRVTDNPHIFSNGYHFCLPESDPETELGYIVPQWIDTPPEGLVPSDTYIILPLIKSDFGYDKIEIMLRDIEPEVILFLSTLEEIRIETDTGDNLTILKDSAAMPEVAIIVEGNKQGSAFSNSDNFLVCNKRFNKPADIHHEKREGIEDREVSVAVPLNANSAASGKIFAYLPIRSDTGFPFLINADFILPSSREDIQDAPWNYWLMRCIADLIACELFPFLKKRKILLNVRFLESLANRLNNLVYNTDDLFYAIYAKVREVLKNEALLPANDNSFVSARDAVLTRSDAVRNLLTDIQLGMLLRPNVNGNVTLKWLSAAITLDRTPSLRRYIMDSLEVEEVTPDMFARRLSKKFLSRQTDEWFIKFYKFLSDQPALWRSGGSVLRTKPILRLQDGTHVNPSQEDLLPAAYLSVGTNTNAALPVVKWEISQDEDAYNFLKALGVQESDIVAEVIEIVLPKYKQEFPTISINEHLRDFKKIQRAYKTDSREKKAQLREALQNTPFIQTENPDEDENVYRKPGEIYFRTEELRLYFAGEPSCAFVNLDVYPSVAVSLFKDLGVLDSVRIQREESDSQGYVTILKQHGHHKRGLDRFDPRIQVDGLEHALTNPTLEKSAFIWNHIVIPNTGCIRGILEESGNKNYVDSTFEECTSYYFGNLLLNSAWLPDSNGSMHKPSKISLDGLPDPFKKDEQVARILGMPFSKARIIEIVAPEIGVSSDILNRIIDATPETIEQIESLLQSTTESVLIPAPVPYSASFPVNSVSNPDRRKKQILSQLEEAPDQEYAEKVRSVRTTRGMIDPKTWLREQYTNDDDQMICQICHEEMPFKYRGENYYFDAVEILKNHFTKEYEAQFLALCPECSPKYRTFIKQVPEAMDSLRQQLVDSDESGDFEIPLKLGDWNTSLRFVERHWLDMKTVLGFYAQHPKQPEPTVEKAAVLPPKTAELKRVISPQLVEKKEVWDADLMLQQHFAQPVRFVTYKENKDLSDIETSAYDLTGVDSKGRKISLTKFEILFAFPKEEMSALKSHVQVIKQLKDRSLQPVEGYKNRFQVADKLLRQVKKSKSNVKVVVRAGHVLSGWIQHFDKYVLYMRVAEKVVVVYRHGLFDFKVENR
ncbi:MAG: RNA chaperone Hfq [Candidatus Poribacteria bacterium]|nr:RNA chaperone Hfq [Candidatus Poribacteria bacterium]